MSNFFQLIGARPTAIATSAANLRTEPSAKYVQGQLVLVPIAATPTQFSWDAASLAADDGTTVIKPNDIAPLAPGRFLLLPGPPLSIPGIARTLFVDGTFVGISTGTIVAPYKTIQDAINAVPPGGPGSNPWQILVAPGNYPEAPVTLANQQIVIQPFGTPMDAAGGDQPLIGVNNFTFTTSGSTNQPYLALRGFNGVIMFVDETVPPASVGVLDLLGCTFNGIASSVGFFGGLLNMVSTVVTPGNVTMGSATVRTSRCSVAGTLSALTWQDSESSVVGNVNVTSGLATPGMVLEDSNVQGLLTCNVITELALSGTSLKSAARFGGLAGPTLVTNASRWKGGAGYYDIQHTVREESLSPTLDLTDEYVILRPAAATTINVTLPDARLFVGNGYAATETNAGTTRTPARHLIIKNGAVVTDGLVAFLPGTGAQRIDGQLTSGVILFPGESVVLVPVFNTAFADWSWETLYRFGRNYQVVSSLGLSATAGAAYVTKATITTPPLRGTYRINYHCMASVSNAATDVQTRLRNVTDAADLVVCRSDPDSTVERIVHSGFANVSFVGVAKTFTIDFQAPAGVANAQVENAWIEIWRVF